MFEIPALLVAFAALITTLVIMTHREETRIPIKIFSLPFILQFFTYVFFSFDNTSLETKQFIARLNLITTDLALSIILLVLRWK